MGDLVKSWLLLAIVATFARPLLILVSQVKDDSSYGVLGVRHEDVFDGVN